VKKVFIIGVGETLLFRSKKRKREVCDRGSSRSFSKKEDTQFAVKGHSSRPSEKKKEGDLKLSWRRRRNCQSKDRLASQSEKEGSLGYWPKLDWQPTRITKCPTLETGIVSLARKSFKIEAIY